ncbi:leucine-rich repeat-containing protein 18 [Scleropages formosus]|nr:leucine-rich repeat-containing protein 18-like [Scleropages formosus]
MTNRKKQQLEPKGRKITLKMAINALQVTVDGKRRLDLSNMQIATFPRCLLKLADVDELDLSRNLLQRIPDSIEQFLNLRWLDLHSNQLEELPATIGNLQGLLHLNLCNNQLTAAGLPTQMGQLRRLRSLNLGMNRLERLPSSLGALRELRELGLFNNLLTRMPDFLDRLPHLCKLNTSSNPIVEPGDGKELDPIVRVQFLHLVDMDWLCESCHERCTSELKKLDRLGAVSGHVHTKPAFSGLVSPNSVALEDQELWR